MERQTAITSTQQGVITEAEFAKVVILTTDGALVPARPVADDDRRDYEIHIRRHFLESLAMQLKTAKRLRLHGRSRMLQINFRVKAPLVTDDRLWYFLAYFDVDEMRLRQARGRRQATDVLSLGGIVWLQAAAAKQRQRRRAA